MKITFHHIVKNLSWALLICGIPLSCKKLIEVHPPADQLTTDAVFSSDETATSAILGLYSEIMKFNNYIGNGALSVYPGLSADEITRTATNATDDAFSSNSIPTNSTVLQTNLWQKAYNHIYQANAILENLSRSESVSAGVKDQLSGEAKFLRAFFHFYLVNLFGPVPQVTSTDYRLNQSIVRSDTALVYQQIVRDLAEAVALLKDQYPSQEKVRVNKWAAAALLSRVYLYQKEWEKAEKLATQVINSGAYQLAPPAQVFLPNSIEAILQFVPAQNQIFNTSEGFSFIPASSTARPNYKLTSYLLSAFEPGDARKSAWVKSTTISGVTYYYPYKYKVRSGQAGSPKSEYNVVLRFSEQYLIRAEARVHQNKIIESLMDLNAVRSRSGLPDITASEPAALLQAIEKERQVELFSEWGHRWMDLKRTGRANDVLGVVKAPNWQATDVWYPIPQNEILSNPSLTQNAGY
jgi:hypothetical protein